MTAYGGTSALLPAAASRRVRDVLAGPVREASVLHRGTHALYLEVDGWCLGVVSASATAVPCALVVATPTVGTPATTITATAGDGALRLVTEAGAVEVRVGRLVDVSVPRLSSLPSPDLVSTMRAHSDVAEAELGVLVTGPELPILQLLGRGSGLTPLGDDVLCGWTAMARALGLATPDLGDPRRRTTLFSATLLDCARRGEVLPAFAHLLRAVGSGDLAAVDVAAASLARVGHTSGSGLLLGACLCLDAARAADLRRCA